MSDRDLFFARQHGKTAIEFIALPGARAYAELAAHHARAYLKRRAARELRRARRDVYESLGMRRVRGALGGVYYE